jgi:hypothetical protein
MIFSILNGDWRFFWPDVVPTLCHLPSTWDSSLNTGLGIPDANTLWITGYLNLTSCASHIGLSWNLISLLFWILPPILISFISSYLLFIKVLAPKKIFGILAAIIYTTNTYFLLVFMGGQTGICLAYACIPALYLAFIQLVRSNSFRNSFILGLLLGLQLWWDIRFVYMTLGSIILLMPFLLTKQIKKLQTLGYLFISLLEMGLLHSYWILPAVVGRSVGIPHGFFEEANVYFFSFADFSHAFSLLHPNWPENIFGKVSFLQPEFLLIPIFAFLFLLFKPVKKESPYKYLPFFFVMLAVVGTFLAKGTNDPFGFVFVFLFNHFPGFVMFRDPTKFYAFISIGYAMLIPFSLLSVSSFFPKRYRVVLPIFFLFFWILLLRQANFPLSSFFRLHRVPNDYQNLQSLLANQKQFSRTLWIPTIQRYRYLSDLHPTLPMDELSLALYNKPNVPLQKLLNKEQLTILGIEYVIVPYDSEKELFLKDRKYYQKLYMDTIKQLEQFPWLQKQKAFTKLAVFKLPQAKDHMFMEDPTNKTIIQSITPVSTTEYHVLLRNAQKGETVVFSENYNSGWSAHVDNLTLSSTPYKHLLNSFPLPKTGNYTLSITYQPQRYVWFGLLVSIFTLCVVVGGIIFLKL